MAVFQKGVRPVGLKAPVGKGREAFATMRRQGAGEFSAHLVAVLRRHAKLAGADPMGVFAFGVEQRVQGGERKRVSYRVDATDTVSVPGPAREKGKDVEGKVLCEDVPLAECVDIVAETEALEYQCPACHKEVIGKQGLPLSRGCSSFTRRGSRSSTEYLRNSVSLSSCPESDELTYLGRGLQLNESELPNDDAAAAPGVLQFNEAAMAQLEAMGFPTIRCQTALLATGNNDPEAAMEWFFAHMEDPDMYIGMFLLDPVYASGWDCSQKLTRRPRQTST
ncbi:hypothetical protein BC628DRAFT_119025 [Trametes gibbosa]|nr:hypothetical protein BC628DRAFT_119025 [Trametes gibbosa]